MATKTADKKKTQAAPAPQLSAAENSPAGSPERLAADYLATRVHQFLISYGEPARLGDIAQGLADDGVTPNLARYALTQYPSRFIQVDRRWDVRTRYLDRQRPTSKLLEEIVATYDSPIAAWDAAHELGMVINRSAEGTRPMVERLMKSSGTYMPLVESGNEIKYGLTSWMLDIRDEYHGETDILFYNYLPAEAAQAYDGVKADWESDPVAASLAVIAATPGAAPKVVNNRLLLYVAWKALQEDFVATDIFSALATSGQFFWLPGHRWTDEAGIAALRAKLAAMAEQVAEMPEEEELSAEVSTPLTIKAADFNEMARIVGAANSATSVTQLLEDVYQISAGERTFAQDHAVLMAALRGQADRFLWVGYDRFRAAGSLPPFIGQIPESLQFPVVPQIPDHNEDLLDQIIDDEGFERGLDRDIRNAIAMDVGDQDPPEMTLFPGGEQAESRSLRLILKAHHKEIGTFPLCQVPYGFFTTEPSVIELTLRDARGAEHQVFADYETQLIYGIGLFDLYETISADSGAIFSLERTAVPGEFRFVNNNETDENFYITPDRLEQLQSYRGEIESGPATSTHDIVRYILEHSNQAMSFFSLLAEVNIVRRTTRRQLASILSAWSAFVLKGGLWNYDPKKSASGFNKNKRKYVF